MQHSYTTTVEQRWIFKCGRCRHVLARDFTISTVHTTYEMPLHGMLQRSVRRTVIGAPHRDGVPVVWCPSCGNHRDGPIMVGRAVAAQHNSRIACTASCRRARRPDCECSCAGANHASDYIG